MMTWAMTLVLLAGLPDGRSLLAMSLSEQRQTMAALTAEERTEVVRSLSIAELVALEQRAARAMATWQAKVVRAERVGGSMLAPEMMQVWVRNSPAAMRLQTVTGPKKGRSVLYNAALRQDELRAKEAGFLSVVGGVWIGLDSAFARADSNHRVTDLGFVPATEMIARIMRDTEKFGPLKRTFVRADDTGVCERFEAPPNAKGLYATNSLICFDPVSSLPLHFEISDAEGLLERYTWSEVQPSAVGQDFFTVASAGLQ